MIRYVFLIAALLPVAARGESTRMVLATPSAPTGALGLTYQKVPGTAVRPTIVPAPPGVVPGLSLVLPTPKVPSSNLPPIVVLVPPGKSPGTPFALLTPLAPTDPAPPSTPARLGVFRDDDRAVTRTFHPLLTPGTVVSILPVESSKP
ncbi:MAG TPA: hypothetical protein VGM51_18880 [Armatimonadota bacterium]|jgi:hypothetical protein